MQVTKQGNDQPALRCFICHKEIPHAEALTMEGKEYAYYFCGQGCFQQWEQKNNANERTDSTKH